MKVPMRAFPHSDQTRDIERQELPNGIRVITERMPQVRSVSVGIWIGTGSREEDEHESGISHFVEHMVFKGTKEAHCRRNWRAPLIRLAAAWTRLRRRKLSATT